MKYITILFLFALFGCMTVSNFEAVLTNTTQKSFWVEKRKTTDSLAYTNHQWEFYTDGSAECFLSFNPKLKGNPIIFNIHKQHNYEWKYDAKKRNFGYRLGGKIPYNKI